MKNKAPLLLALSTLLVYSSLALTYGGILTEDGGYYLMDGFQLLEGRLPETRAHRIVHQSTIALLESVFGYNLFLIRLYPIACATLSALLMYLILRTAFDNKKSLTGAFLLASGPALVYISPMMITDGVGLFYSLLGLYLYLLAMNRNGAKFIMLSGFALSLGFLARETIISVVFVILLHQLYGRKYREMMTFVASFAFLPLVYLMFLLSIGEPNPWLSFFTKNVELYGAKYPKASYFLRQYAIGMGILGMWGIYAILKRFRELKVSNPLDFLFAGYFTVSLGILVFWPGTPNIRFFAILLPGLSYFAVKTFDGKATATLAILTVITGYSAGILIGYVSVMNQGTTVDAVDWVSEKIPPGHPIFTNNMQVAYHLKNRNYDVRLEPGDGAEYAVMTVTRYSVGVVEDIPQLGDAELLEEFSYRRPDWVRRFAFGQGQTTGVYKLRY